MSLVPTLPTSSTVDKRVQITPLERVDTDDFNNFTALERAALAHMMWGIVDNGSKVVSGLKIVSDSAQGAGSDNMTVWAQPGKGLQAGYLAKLIAASQLAVPANTSGVTRTDHVGIRFVEQSSDTVARRQLQAIERIPVSGEAVATGDGTTVVFDLANENVDGRTLIVRVDGAVAAAVLVPGTGGGGVDQIAFDDPPGLALAVTADYVRQNGGVEQSANLDTRFSAACELQYAAGVALDAGFMELASISVVDGATAIATANITDKRAYLFHADGSALTTLLAKPQYERFGIGVVGVGVETDTLTYASPQLALVAHYKALRINGVMFDTGGGGGVSVAPSLDLENSVSLANTTWYHVYACHVRTADGTNRLIRVITNKGPTLLTTCSGNITKTIDGRVYTILAADTIYLGSVYYLNGTNGFARQRRCGDRVMYLQPQGEFDFNAAGVGGSGTTVKVGVGIGLTPGVPYATLDMATAAIVELRVKKTHTAIAAAADHTLFYGGFGADSGLTYPWFGRVVIKCPTSTDGAAFQYAQNVHIAEIPLNDQGSDAYKLIFFNGEVSGIDFDVWGRVMGYTQPLR